MSASLFPDLPRTAVTTARPGSAPILATAPAEYAVTGARLGRAVLGYVVAVILVITLAPFAFRVPDVVHVVWWSPEGKWHGWFDVVANVALFTPVGFLFALTRAATAPGRPGSAWRATAFGAALSAGVECAQLFEAARFPSPTDVATNTLGTLLGAWLYRRLAGRLGADTPLVGRLALELPVMGLVYVALPLLTLAALTAAGGPVDHVAFPPRPAMVVALALFGAALLGTVQRRRAGAPPAATVGTCATAAAAVALWVAIGALPALATAPRAFAAALGAAPVVAWLVAGAAARGRERRFEGEAIGRAAPFLVLYLALLPFGRAPLGDGLSDDDLLYALQGVCAFAVLGYLLAEAWGRRELRYRHAVLRVGPTAAVVAGAQLLLGGGPGHEGAGRVLAGVTVRALCAAYGGWVYHLQRAHVRALVAARHGAALGVQEVTVA